MSENLETRIAELEAENTLLRKTIELQKRQMKEGGFGDEARRLRAKIAEWEGSSRYSNGGYYHGAKFIRQFIDNPDAGSNSI